MKSMYLDINTKESARTFYRITATPSPNPPGFIEKLKGHGWGTENYEDEIPVSEHDNGVHELSERIEQLEALGYDVTVRFINTLDAMVYQSTADRSGEDDGR